MSGTIYVGSNIRKILYQIILYVCFRKRHVKRIKIADNKREHTNYLKSSSKCFDIYFLFMKFTENKNLFF